MCCFFSESNGIVLHVPTHQQSLYHQPFALFSLKFARFLFVQWFPSCLCIIHNSRVKYYCKFKKRICIFNFSISFDIWKWYDNFRAKTPKTKILILLVHFISLHIRIMWETICDAWACWSGWNFGPKSSEYPLFWSTVSEYPPPPPIENFSFFS